MTENKSGVVNMTLLAASKQVSDRFVIGERAGLNAILSGIIVMRIHTGVAGRTSAQVQEEIWRALNKSAAEGGPGFSRATCDNKLSRMKTASDPKFFAWQIDPNATIASNCAAILPEFREFWLGSVNNIKASGPADVVGAPRGGKKPAETPPAVGTETAVAPSLSDADAVHTLVHLGTLSTDMDAEQLSALRDLLSDAIAEIDVRLAAMAADVPPMAIAA